MRLSKYLTLFQLTWQEYFAYRINFALEVFGSIFLILVTTFVWSMLFQSHGPVIAGFSEKEMILYVVGAGILSSFLFLTAQGDDINDDIHQGRLSVLLLKPLHPNAFWLIRDMCRKFLTLGVGMLGYIFVLLIYRSKLFLPESLSHIVWFFLFCFLAALLHFVLFYVLSILGFWLEQAWGFRFVMRVMMEVTSGVLIPFSFFAPLWQKLFYFLPFKFFAFVPMQVYLGNATVRQTWHFFLEGLLWLGGLVIIGYFLWRRGVRSYAAQGH